MVTFSDIKKAADNIKGAIVETPICVANFCKNNNYNVYLKCENLQYTGSAAERGIRNALMSRDYSQGVIVPSKGSMAIGTAYHGNNLDIPVTVVLPDHTSPAIAQRCSENEAEVILYGENLDDAMNYAKKFCENGNQKLLSSNDPEFIAGLGTVGLEIMTQLPDVGAVIVPVARGSLLAATLVACKAFNPRCLVYGVECAKVPKMMKALLHGKPFKVPLVPNLADGLNASVPGSNAFSTLKGRLDRMLLVDEVWVAKALITMLERERLVTDGAAVCSIAAVMQGLVPELRGKKIVCVLNGGTIEPNHLMCIIQRALGVCGRLIKFSVPMTEHSGLMELSKMITEQDVVLKSIGTEQIRLGGNIGTLLFNVVVETANEVHAANFKDHIRQTYPTAVFTTVDTVDSLHVQTETCRS